MIALLLISHSATLAQGVRDLAQQMAPELPILAAGGTDEGEIGTSFEKIYQGMTEGLAHDGLLVLMDLGSAVMTAESALDMLDEAQRARVRLSNGPLVEGALAAATTAAGGASLDEVAAAAHEAASMQKGVAGTTPPEGALSPKDAGDWRERHVTVPNAAGLHARPAAQIVRLLAPLDAEVHLCNASTPTGPAKARSMIALLSLAARQGDLLTIRARGREAEAALDAVAQLIGDGFGERDDSLTVGLSPPDATQRPSATGDEITGYAASGGIAIGTIWWLEGGEVEGPARAEGTVAEESARLEQALTEACHALDRLAAARGAEAAIFAAQATLLQDETLRDAALQRIRNAHCHAATAWLAVTREEAARLRGSANALIAERADDLIDVGQRVARAMLGEPPLGRVPDGAVVVAETLTPSLLPPLASAGAVALVSQRGGPTSHVAILARGLGLPAILGVGPAVASLVNDQRVIVDGDRGRLLIDPDEPTRTKYQQRAVAAQRQLDEARQAAQAAARTQAGRRVVVAANVASVAEAEAAVVNGADGVGLLRTEFLFLDRADLPSEQAQRDALRAIFAPLGERPIIVRTLDIGGDKEAPALKLTPERNGFLGERGLRHSLRHPDLFRRQLRAILRAAHGHRVSLMFPMVTTVDEVVQARTLLDEVQQRLAAAGAEWAAPEEVGIMVEVPAAALAAADFAPHVDFFSVGSNDLIQYTMAAERTNEAVASLYQPDHPALWTLLGHLIRAAHAAERWVGLCGELGGNPAYTARLVALGFDELSMAPAAIPAVKAAVRAG
ncbi:MAG: phosphoenolpyruvate--protein phosphotransferase [Anaerolineales bacterium]|nr:phosphoenolpyruvate--protein phosphotransferase [Anaerolineales bacterium]MCB9126562.1 phosphoenolpyruvate--protein phosphotransferase [Ardenticatenales bacterium]MCB9172512.1 phosphoenolpyruvate--protein phosphotransferase [Ardenticatenales bacterium]